ncbi:1,4-alpha-glucan branching enzyme, partial [Acinetobacter baumannii]
MGNEFGATTEWNYKSELPWNLLQYVSHGGMKYCVATLNKLYRSLPALYQKQFTNDGFEWIDLNHRNETVITYMRKGN